MLVHKKVVTADNNGIIFNYYPLAILCLKTKTNFSGHSASTQLSGFWHSSRYIDRSIRVQSGQRIDTLCHNGGKMPRVHTP